MEIAYLVNQYPKVSHSFIRREIAGVEAHGVTVKRYSIRSCEGELVDEGDRAEFTKTHILLNEGLPRLFLSCLVLALTRFPQWVRALKLAVKLGLASHRGVLHHLIYLVEACRFFQLVRRDGIGHVHAHFGTNSTTVAMLCRELGGPSYSFTVHGPEEFDCPQALGLTEKIHRAAFVVAISSFGRSQLYRWCDYPHWSKIQVVRCGVDASFVKEPMTSIPEAPRLVCVGRLCEQKGQVLLVDAARQLKEDGYPFELVLVGDGEMRPTIEAMMRDYQLQDCITITGWASGAQVRQYLLDARAMVLPSFAEGLPVVIMEALALSRPVLSTYIAGIPELVEPGNSGWLVQAGSVKALAEAMKTILQLPPQQLEQMGKVGTVRVNQLHNVTIETGRLVSLFAASLEKAPRV
ncbi:MAG: glycosyltransferase [Synechococcales bacterium]|nr:glycosyltransferase [Synechococcales bacterium]